MFFRYSLDDSYFEYCEKISQVEESRARRKELAAAREKEGEQEREDMLKSSEVRKESSKREREEGRTSKEGKNPLRNSSRTRRSPVLPTERATRGKKRAKRVKWKRR
jgi:hypothetical protein